MYCTPKVRHKTFGVQYILRQPPIFYFNAFPSEKALPTFSPITR